MLSQDEILALTENDVIYGVLRYRDHDRKVYVLHAGRLTVAYNYGSGEREFSPPQLGQHGVSFGDCHLTYGGFKAEDTWVDLFADADEARKDFEAGLAAGEYDNADHDGFDWKTAFEV